VMVAIGSMSSNMRWVLFCGWGIGRHLLCRGCSDGLTVER
jgi:hypothetical protein